MEDKTLVEQFTQAYGLLHRYQHLNAMQAGGRGNIHRGQGRVLALLRMQPEISQKELSYLLDMRSQSLGELLAKLEKNGFITRSASEQDRRVMEIKLTDAGKEAAGQMEKQQEDFEKVLDFLSDEEKQQFSKLLEHIIAELEPKMKDADIPGFGFGFERPPFGRHPYGSGQGCRHHRQGFEDIEGRKPFEGGPERCHRGPAGPQEWSGRCHRDDPRGPFPGQQE